MLALDQFIPSISIAVISLVVILASVSVQFLRHRLYPYGSVKNTYILPFIVNILSSERLQRFYRVCHSLLNRKPTAKLWIACDDPYSFILLQSLDKFSRHWNLRIDVYILPHEDKNLSIVEQKYK